MIEKMKCKYVKQDRKVFPCQRLLNKHKICTKDRTENWKLWQQISTLSRHTEDIKTQNTVSFDNFRPIRAKSKRSNQLQD